MFSRDRPEITAGEAAELLGRPRSTVYRLLAQIEKEGFLDRDEDTGRYRLGIRLAVLGEVALHSTSLQRIALPFLRQLSQETGETSTLLLLIEGEGVAVQHVESVHRVAARAALGRMWPLHASAGGKSLLAWLPESDQRSLLRRSLPRYTETTITTLEGMRRELQLTRQRGYSMVRGEFMDDIWGVAVPVFNHRDGVEAAITLGGPRSRVSRDTFPALGAAAMQAGEQVSRCLGYQGLYPRVELAKTDQVTGSERARTNHQASVRRAR